MTQGFRSKANLFFKDPAEPPPDQGKVGILYALRRDIDVCFGRDPNTKKCICYEAHFPGTMAILAGIDLLGKFLCGSDSTGSGKIQERFRCFIESYAGLSPDKSKDIWLLRNVLLHSFGLYSEHAGGKFKLITKGTELITSRDGAPPIVNMLVLRDKFENAVTKYKEELEEDENLQKKFCSMFCKYGFFHITKVP